ncbi:hypothetical protein BKA56DRAFT_693874 [Ilyonectria sp. MPI-CAGE-AT-0026]|nr:hypothetical protein BKA56DRAFT_693874 [Ilyonectria sp. MPI-CAGE-AT-0026]
MEVAKGRSVRCGSVPGPSISKLRAAVREMERDLLLSKSPGELRGVGFIGIIAAGVHVGSQLPLANRRKAFLSTSRTRPSFLGSMPLVKQNTFALAAIIQPSTMLTTPHRPKSLDSTTVDIEVATKKRKWNGEGEEHPPPDSASPKAAEKPVGTVAETQLADIFRHELQQVKKEILAHVDKQFDNLDMYNKDEVDDRFYVMEKQAKGIMSTKVDEDNLDDVKMELEVCAKEEIMGMGIKVEKRLGKRLIKRLEASSWNLEMDSDSKTNLPSS